MNSISFYELFRSFWVDKVDEISFDAKPNWSRYAAFRATVLIWRLFTTWSGLLYQVETYFWKVVLKVTWRWSSWQKSDFIWCIIDRDMPFLARQLTQFRRGRENWARILYLALRFNLHFNCNIFHKKTALKLLWKCSESAPKVLWKCSESALKICMANWWCR